MTFCGKVFMLSLLMGFDFDFCLEKKNLNQACTLTYFYQGVFGQNYKMRV